MSLLPVHRYALCTIENRSVTQPHSILYNAHNTPTDSKKETAIDICYSFFNQCGCFCWRTPCIASWSHDHIWILLCLWLLLWAISSCERIITFATANPMKIDRFPFNFYQCWSFFLLSLRALALAELASIISFHLVAHVRRQTNKKTTYSENEMPASHRIK